MCEIFVDRNKNCTSFMNWVLGHVSSYLVVLTYTTHLWISSGVSIASEGFKKLFLQMSSMPSCGRLQDIGHIMQ